MIVIRFRMMILLFQSTLSMRRANVPRTYASCICQFQSTLSMRRAITFCHGLSPCEYISIHALHEESEIESDREDFAELNFNPRSP